MLHICLFVLSATLNRLSFWFVWAIFPFSLLCCLGLLLCGCRSFLGLPFTCHFSPHTSLVVILYFSFLIIFFHFRLFPSTLEIDDMDVTPTPPHLLINFYSIFYSFQILLILLDQIHFLLSLLCFLLSSFPYFFLFNFWFYSIQIYSKSTTSSSTCLSVYSV